MKAAYLLPMVFACSAAGVAMVVACGPGTPIGQPAGSNNFDDPDDPGQSGQNNTGPDGSGDANGQACTAPRDCPAAFVCAYPIADTCGASGRCVPFDVTTCGDAGVACGCDSTAVVLCAPPGYAPKPIVSTGACDGGFADASSTDAASE